MTTPTFSLAQLIWEGTAKAKGGTLADLKRADPDKYLARREQLEESLAARFKEVVGEPIEPSALSHLADEAFVAEENGTKFKASDWDDALKAEADTIEKYLAANGAEKVKQEEKPVTNKPDNKTLDERVAEAVERASPGDPRNRYAARTAAVKAAHLVQQGLSDGEAVSKAIEQMYPGTPASKATAQLATELQDAGLSADQAQIEAAKASLALQKRKLAERAAAAAVEKQGVDPEVAAIAGVFKEWRVKKGLTQEALAAEVGITSRQIQKIEAGQALPQGLNAFRLANALALPIEVIRECGRLQPRTEGD